MCSAIVRFLQVSPLPWRDSPTSLGPHLPCTGEIRTGPSIPGVASPVLSRRERLSPSTCNTPKAAKDITCIFCCDGTLLAHIQLGVHQDSQGLFCKAEFESLKSLSLNIQTLFLKCTFRTIALWFVKTIHEEQIHKPYVYERQEFKAL